ncbi:hypothetical protein Tco_1365722 [Tanacetum coccineum]
MLLQSLGSASKKCTDLWDELEIAKKKVITRNMNRRPKSSVNVISASQVINYQLCEQAVRNDVRCQLLGRIIKIDGTFADAVNALKKLVFWRITNDNITLPGVTNMLPVVMTISTSNTFIKVSTCVGLEEGQQLLNPQNRLHLWRAGHALTRASTPDGEI